MRHALKMELWSRKELTRRSASRHLEFLTSFGGGIFIPERCDVGEPLRETFDPANLNEPVRWMTQPGSQFTFRRTHSVRLFGWIKNERFRRIRVQHTRRGKWEDYIPSVAEPIFLTTWVLWIDRAVLRTKSIQSARDFFLAACDVSEADFGFLTPEEDHQLKNYLVTVGNKSTSMKFVGDNPEKGIPGLYWMNAFGSGYVNWIGADKFGQVECADRQWLANGSVFLQFGCTPDEAVTDSVAGQQKRAIQTLNPDAFFDISQADRDLAVPEFASFP